MALFEQNTDLLNGFEQQDSSEQVSDVDEIMLSGRWQRHLDKTDPQLEQKQFEVIDAVEKLLLAMPSLDSIRWQNMLGVPAMFKFDSSYRPVSQMRPWFNKGAVALLGVVGSGKSETMLKIQKQADPSVLVFTEKGYKHLTGKYNQVRVIPEGNKFVFKYGEEILFTARNENGEISDLDRLLAYTHIALRREADTAALMYNLRNNYGHGDIPALRYNGIFQILGYIFSSARMNRIPGSILRLAFFKFGIPQQIVVTKPDPEVREKWMQEVEAATEAGVMDKDELIKRESYRIVDAEMQTILENLAIQYERYCAEGDHPGKARILITSDEDDIDAFLQELKNDHQLQVKRVEHAFSLSINAYLRNPNLEIREDLLLTVSKIITYLEMFAMSDKSILNERHFIYSEAFETLQQALENSLVYILDLAYQEVGVLLPELTEDLTLVQLVKILEELFAGIKFKDLRLKHGRDALINKFSNLHDMNEIEESFMGRLAGGVVSEPTRRNLTLIASHYAWLEHAKPSYPNLMEIDWEEFNNEDYWGNILRFQGVSITDAIHKLVELSELPLAEMLREYHTTPSDPYELRDRLTARWREEFNYGHLERFLSGLGYVNKFGSIYDIKDLMRNINRKITQLFEENPVVNQELIGRLAYINYLIFQQYIRVEKMSESARSGSEDAFKYSAQPYTSHLPDNQEIQDFILSV